jgi:hypothetical protein
LQPANAARLQRLQGLAVRTAVKVDALILDPRLLAEIENLRVLDGCRM